ncbi:hypothetical protein EON63_08160 [archaeon]|nr:MAG: hypothetical protein EON63_08160 [archaeon]
MYEYTTSGAYTHTHIHMIHHVHTYTCIQTQTSGRTSVWSNTIVIAISRQLDHSSSSIGSAGAVRTPMYVCVCR